MQFNPGLRYPRSYVSIALFVAERNVAWLMNLFRAWRCDNRIRMEVPHRMNHGFPTAPFVRSLHATRARRRGKPSTGVQCIAPLSPRANTEVRGVRTKVSMIIMAAPQSGQAKVSGPEPASDSATCVTSSGLNITGSVRGLRTECILPIKSARLSVISKKNFSPLIAALSETGEAPRSTRCNW
jgi:hypothetical protein